MLTKLRDALKPKIDKLGLAASRTRLSPTGWTVLGLVFASTSAAVYSRVFLTNEALAAIFLLLSGFTDIIDGAVAKATNTVTARGSFLDSTLDRVGEVLIYLAIALSGQMEPYLPVLAVTLSLLVSYERAKAESLNVRVEGVGIGERAERLIVLAASSIVGWLRYGVILVVLLATVTFLHRIYVVLKVLSN